MPGVHLHCEGAVLFSGIYLHSEKRGNKGKGGCNPEKDGINTTRLYPPEIRHSKGRDKFSLSPNDAILWQNDLYFSKRGRETLVVEPESANWIVLNDRFFSLFELMRMPIHLFSLCNNPYAPADETERFVSYLLLKNIIRRRDWPALFHPVMPSPLLYPSFLSIHVTESCNFGCKYCYGDAPSSGKKMKKETVIKIIDRIFEELTRQDITIEFHGGEPLLVRDVVEAACQRIKELWNSKKETKCRILVQTNASMIDMKSIEFFRKYDISVGVSMDGPARIHDRSRIYRDGRGTHCDTQRGLNLLKEQGIAGGILAVVEDPKDYIEIADYIFSQGYFGFRLNHLVCQGRGEVDISSARVRGEKFAMEFMDLIDFLDYYARNHRELRIDVWPVNIMLFHLISHHRPFMCMRSPCGAGSHGLGFDYKGNVYPCEQLAGFEELSIGNIEDDSLLSMLEKSPVIKNIRSRVVEKIEKCRICTWRNFCGGGCTAEAYSITKDLFREDAHCSFYERSFENLMWELHRKGDLSHLLGQFR